MKNATLDQFKTAEPTTEPAPTPSVSDTLSYEDIDSHEDLIEWSQQYTVEAIEEYDMDVDVDGIIDWEVTTQAKRRAAAIKRLNITGTSVGIPVNWDAIREKANISPDSDIQDPYDVCMSLTWGAFEEFNQTEWEETLRHELVHVEHHQKFAASNHGKEFKRRAEEVDAAEECPKFTDYNYHLFCTECDTMIDGRYQKSKIVKQPETYLSGCCEAPLRSEEA